MNLLLIVLANFVFLIVLARSFFFLVDVQGNSMRPALWPGDRVLALRIFPARWLRRGQIIVLRFEAQEEVLDVRPAAEESALYIKRLVGLPGETVSFPFAELPAFCQKSQASQDHTQGMRIWHIPRGHGFVKGDSFGFDSTLVGPIPLQNVRGVVVMKLRRSFRSTGVHERMDFDDFESPSR